MSRWQVLSVLCCLFRLSVWTTVAWRGGPEWAALAILVEWDIRKTVHGE